MHGSESSLNMSPKRSFPKQCLAVVMAFQLSGIGSFVYAADEAISREASFHVRSQPQLISEAYSREFTFHVPAEVEPIKEVASREFSFFIGELGDNGDCTNAAVVFTWDPVPGINGFLVELSEGAPDDGSIIDSAVVLDTTVAIFDQGLTNGETYYGRLSLSTDGGSTFTTPSPFTDGIKFDQNQPLADVPTASLALPNIVGITYSGSDDSAVDSIYAIVALDSLFTSILLDTHIVFGDSIELVGTPGLSYFATAQLLDCAGNLSAISEASFRLYVPLPPDLAVTEIGAPANGIGGYPFVLNWTVANQSPDRSAQGPWVDEVYLSTDSTLGLGTDYLLGSVASPGTLQTAQSYSRTRTFNLPVTEAELRPIIVVDAKDQVEELDGENNNTQADDDSISVTLLPLADLVPDSALAPPTAVADQDIQVTWFVTNQGNGGTNAASWEDAIFLSPMPSYSPGSSIRLGDFSNASFLLPGEAYQNVETVRIPKGTAGTYWITIVSDHEGRVPESDGDNNVVASDSIVIGLGPVADLRVTALSVAGTVISGDTIQVSWTVTNQGTGPTNVSAWRDYVIYSADSILDFVFPAACEGISVLDQVLVGISHDGTLAPDSSYTVMSEVRIPHFVEGTHLIAIYTDLGVFKTCHGVVPYYDDHVYELNDFNNTRTDTLAVILRPPPDLIVDSVYADPTGSSGDSVSVSWTILNDGAGATVEGSWQDRVYLSTSAFFDVSSAIPLGISVQSGGLFSLGSYSKVRPFRIPDGLEGTYYVFVHTDWANNVFENSADSNNVGMSLSPTAMSLSPWPDLITRSISAPVSDTAGSTINLSWFTGNEGAVSVPSNWDDEVFISPDSSGLSGALSFGDVSSVSGLASGDSVQLALSPTLSPTLEGTYYIYVKNDADDDHYEHTDEANNLFRSAPVAITAYPEVDLAVSSIVAMPDSLNSGEYLNVSWEVSNNGNAPTVARTWRDAVRLESMNPPKAQATIPLSTFVHTGDLDPGASYARDVTILLPNTLAGPFSVEVMTDDQGVTRDTSATNNSSLSGPIQVTQALWPDLDVEAFASADSGTAGQPLTSTVEVRNLGPVSTSSSGWFDVVYLSLDTNLDPLDTPLISRERTGPLASLLSYTDTFDVMIPNYVSGGYYLLYVADSQNAVFENGATANNRGVGATIIALPPPADLQVSSVQVPAAAVPGDSVLTSWTITNTGSNAAKGVTRDGVYVSSDDTWGVSDPLIGIFERTIDIPPGGSKTFTQKVSLAHVYQLDDNGQIVDVLPGVAPGDYRFLVRTDLLNTIRETSDANNTGASADSVDVSMTQLTLGVPFNFSLTGEREKHFQLNLTETKDLRVTLTSDDSSASNEVYAAIGRVASLSDFDAAANEPFSASQSSLIPSLPAGPVYFLTKVRDFLSSSQAMAILVEEVPFSIESITPSRGGVGGYVTCEVVGAGFQDSASIWLEDLLGNSHQGFLTSRENTSNIVVRWDTRGLPMGHYDVVVRNGSGPAVRRGAAFSLEEASGYQVQTSVVVPDVGRRGRWTSLQYTFRNIGNIDIPYLLPILMADSALAVQGLRTSVEVRSLASAASRYVNEGDQYPENFQLELVQDDEGNVNNVTVGRFFSKDVSPGSELSITLLAKPTEVGTYGATYGLIPMGVCDFMNDWIVPSISSYRDSILANQLTYPVGLVELALNESAFEDSMEGVLREIGFVDRRIDECSPSLGSREGLDQVFTSAEKGALSPGKLLLCGILLERLCVKVGAVFLCAPLVFAPPVAFLCWLYTELFCIIFTLGTCLLIVGGLDPNEINGPVGFGDDKWMPMRENLHFAAFFENDPELATAPAQRVEVRVPIDEDASQGTFRLGNFGFGSYRFEVPENSAFYTDQLDLIDSLGLLVDVAAGIDVSNREAFWVLQSIDPETGQPPEDPFAGFLPVNDTLTGSGEGFVNFRISPSTDAVTGTLIEAQASIVFDSNAPIATNTHFNTIDAGLPHSEVINVAEGPGNDLELLVRAYDDSGGSGLEGFDVYVSVDGQPFVLAEGESGDSTFVIAGEEGHTYGFFTIARDNAGNREELKPAAEVTIGLGTVFAVWPGDTDNDGTVNQNDVLPVGLYFNESGPSRSGATISWTQQIASLWLAEPAVFADANGDGTVDQNDVLAIGLNFGEVQPSPKLVKSGSVEPISIQLSTAGEVMHFDVALDLDGEVSLGGFAAAISVPIGVEIDSIVPGLGIQGTSPLVFTEWDPIARIYHFAVAEKGAGEFGPHESAAVQIAVRRTLPSADVVKLEVFDYSATLDGRIRRDLNVILNSPDAVVIPRAHVLEANRPNPFNPVTTISFGLPSNENISLDIYDVSGRLVKSVVSRTEYEAGWHSVTIDGSDMASGVYFYRLTAGSYSKAKRMLLLR